MTSEYKNVSLKEELLEDIDRLLDDGKTPFISRAGLITHVLTNYLKGEDYEITCPHCSNKITFKASLNIQGNEKVLVNSEVSKNKNNFNWKHSLDKLKWEYER